MIEEIISYEGRQILLEGHGSERPILIYVYDITDGKERHVKTNLRDDLALYIKKIREARGDPHLPVQFPSPWDLV